MTFLVAFDGSDLAAAALRTAAELADFRDVDVLVVSIIPDDSTYAIRAGWVDDEAEFDPTQVKTMLRDRVHDIAPDARFRSETVHAYASHNTIAKRVKHIARDEDVGVVFIGSDNAGRFTAPVSSVGDKVSSSDEYDVYIVRTE